ncbi:arabinose efflux permease family protein [Candidatus Nitrososphaera evergladensis SR1]|jgi:MFS family permease|uniref:Arabinose efflux permease family protein n=2 Tax=Nitrososphaera TaxID=497726 RepID=A0A075MUS7_9ARCH|nr:arabinose efflux permease family protein [Candidatus Nitrososphaera evergladensis SR1]
MKPILFVAACAAIVGIAYGMHSPIVPVFAKEELGANFSEVGVIGLANYLPYMVVPLFGGMLLDRTNKAYLLILGVSLNAFAIFMLSEVTSVAGATAFRGLSGIAHAFFWPSAEAIISTTAPSDKRVKWIALFTAAWVGGFMTGPLIGKVVLEHFDYRVLFELSALAISLALVPSFFLLRHGRPVQVERHRLLRLGDLKHEVASMPTVSAVVLYYAVTFGVLIAIYPAYMKAASITDQNIELLFFVFGMARFATLPFVRLMAGRGRAALAAAVAVMAASMAISFAFASVWSFAIALVLAGVATSIFYPVTFNFVTKNAPVEKMGTKLGIYEALFGAGWTVGPVGVGLSSDAFGPASPYLAFSVIGAALAGAIMVTIRKNNNSS